jgi:hypothetical protein
LRAGAATAGVEGMRSAVATSDVASTRELSLGTRRG